MFRRNKKNQGYGAQSPSNFSGEDKSFTSNLQNLGLIGSRASKSSGGRPETGTGSQSFADVPTFPEKGMFRPSLIRASFLGRQMPHSIHRGLHSERSVDDHLRNLSLTSHFQVDQFKPDQFARTTARDRTHPLSL